MFRFQNILHLFLTRAALMVVGLLPLCAPAWAESEKENGTSPLSGFSLSGVSVSGVGSGSSESFTLSRTDTLFNDQRAYALLIDGKYDFKYDNVSDSAWRPYVSGGVGMALLGTSGALGDQDGAMVPLFRLGGGIAYRLDEKWNLALDYKTNFMGRSEKFFTGRGQQPVDLSTLNMGMKYKF